MNTNFFSKGHKDVTWVLVKVFLHGSRLAKDPNAALIRLYKFSMTGAYQITGLCTHTDYFQPVRIQGQRIN